MANDLKAVLADYDRYQNVVEQAMVRATNTAAETLLTEMRDLVSLDDHSLADLAALGHPYAQGKPQGSGPHPDYELHQQDEELIQGLRRTPARPLGNLVAAELHSDAPHTWHVIYGTIRMRPRDFVSAALLKEERAIGAIYGREFARATGGTLSQRRQGLNLVEHERYTAELPAKE